MLFQRTVRADRQTALMLLPAMLDRLGVLPAAMPVAAMREMASTCMTCTDHRRCREWLASGEETEFRAFCPNAALLDYALLRQHPRNR
jgi:hypothetical protein